MDTKRLSITNLLLVLIFLALAGILIGVVLWGPPDPPVVTASMDPAYVQGFAADGSAAAGNPVQVGGKDGGGLAQTILTDSSGQPIVTVSDVETGTTTVDFNAKYVDSQETNTLRTIQSEESEVHDGLMFSLDRSLDLADDVYTYLWLHVGASPAHVAIGVWGGGQLGVSLWETSTVSGGTVVEAHNLNRTSSTLPLSVISHTPTIGALGHVLFTNTVIPGGTRNNTRIGGGARSTLEWIFAPGRDYLLGVQNVSGGTVSVTMELDFNEE